MNTTRTLHSLLLALAVFLGATSLPASAQTLLSYWNFNNDASSFATTNPNLAAFSTTAAAYGEAYGSGQLLSNTAGLYHGASVYMDLNYMLTAGAAYGGSVTAGGYVFGLYSDSTTNRIGSDATAGGSLLVGGSSGQAMVEDFHLDSAGYQNLSFSFALRNTVPNSVTVYYSTDGGTTLNLITTLSTATTGTNSFQAETVNLSSISALNNDSSFIIRVSSHLTGGSVSLDNVQLTGTAVPEPSAWACLLLAGGVLVAGRRLLRTRRA